MVAVKIIEEEQGCKLEQKINDYIANELGEDAKIVDIKITTFFNSTTRRNFSKAMIIYDR